MGIMKMPRNPEAETFNKNREAEEKARLKRKPYGLVPKR